MAHDGYGYSNGPISNNRESVYGRPPFLLDRLQTFASINKYTNAELINLSDCSFQHQIDCSLARVFVEIHNSASTSPTGLDYDTVQQANQAHARTLRTAYAGQGQKSTYHR